MANSKRGQQVIYVERKPDRSLLWLVLFGWWYVALVFVRWTWRVVTWPFRFGARVGWAVMFAWPLRLCRAAWDGAVRGTRVVYTRWGMRGIAVAAGVIIVLGVLGTILGNH